MRLGYVWGRAREFLPRFGSREPLSAAVCPISLGLIMLCSVNLPCGEGFGFALSVLLFSLFVVLLFSPTVSCVGVWCSGVGDANEYTMCRARRYLVIVSLLASDLVYARFPTRCSWYV